MVRKKTVCGIIFDVINVAFLTLFAVVCLYPFLYVIFASFSDSQLLELHRGALFKPLGFSTASYKAVFENDDILTGYINTLFYVVVGTSLNLLMTSLGAYVLAKKDFLWNKILLPMVLVTMFFSGGLIPSFLLVKTIGIYDTRWAVILPTLISTWNLFIMRTNFAAIPQSLEESAQIDGANQILVLFKIVLPLSMPVISVMILYYGVAHWNAWFGAMIYLRDRSKYPLQLMLREILISNSTENMTAGMDLGSADTQRVSETVKYATIIVSTLPILLLYPFLQKYFVKGVMVGAVKG